MTTNPTLSPLYGPVFQGCGGWRSGWFEGRAAVDEFIVEAGKPEGAAVVEMGGKMYHVSSTLWCSAGISKIGSCVRARVVTQEARVQV